MSKVRINDLARELEVKSKSILDALTAVGVTEKKTHSSSIEENEAEKVRAYLTRGTRPSSAARPAADTKPTFNLSHVSKPGDALKAILERKQAEAAARSRPPAPTPRPTVAAPAAAAAARPSPAARPVVPAATAAPAASAAPATPHRGRDPGSRPAPHRAPASRRSKHRHSHSAPRGCPARRPGRRQTGRRCPRSRLYASSDPRRRQAFGRPSDPGSGRYHSLCRSDGSCGHHDRSGSSNRRRSGTCSHCSGRA